MSLQLKWCGRVTAAVQQWVKNFSYLINASEKVPALPWIEGLLAAWCLFIPVTGQVAGGQWRSPVPGVWKGRAGTCGAEVAALVVIDSTTARSDFP